MRHFTCALVIPTSLVLFVRENKQKTEFGYHGDLNAIFALHDTGRDEHNRVLREDEYDRTVHDTRSY